MFGKSPREPQKPTMTDLQDIKLSPPASVNLNSPQDTLLQKDTVIVEENELVATIEKISRIASPYFVAIVGLSLYEKNFFIGTILIVVGILSLLKVSIKDVGDFLEWLKNFLGLGR